MKRNFHVIPRFNLFQISKFNSFGIKVEIERLVISISIHSIWVTYSGRLVSFYYITGAAGCVCRTVASSCLLVAVTSTSEQPRVRSKLVLWLLHHLTQCNVYVIQ